ncbi:hypothetical protein PG997_007356 [Apiospora hydei]|uniref:Uncharacterized protein n=1 Tax=Apiospora hydei TaxID=1337664 RepID=A0ABR1W7S8_9PEZI
MYSQALRTASRSGFRVSAFSAPAARPISTSAVRMGSTDRSHAIGESAVPGKIQEKAPQGCRGSSSRLRPPHRREPRLRQQDSRKGRRRRVYPSQKVQEIVPESVEKAVPNALHNTGDK